MLYQHIDMCRKSNSVSLMQESTPSSRGRRDVWEEDNEQDTHKKHVLDPHGETNNERRPFKKGSPPNFLVPVSCT